MHRFRKKRPSAGMAVAFVALLAAVSGTAVALPGKNSVDSGDIKNGSVKSADIKNNSVRGRDIRRSTVKGSDIASNTVKGSDIDESSLGTVPSASAASAASFAATAANLQGLRKVRGFKRVASSSSDADQDTAQAGAAEVVLLTAGPLTIYGKCYTDTDDTNFDIGTYAEAYIKTSLNGAIFDSDDNSANGDPYLNTTTAEDDRALEQASTGGENGAAIDADEDGNFAAVAPDGTTVEGRVEMAAKNGTLAGGDGLYGAGNACLFWGNLLG